MAPSPLEYLTEIEDVSAGLPAFIANGNPVTATGQAIQSGLRAIGDSYSNGAQWVVDFAANWPEKMVGLSDLFGPWLESQGSGAPGFEVPFEGGQCAGRYYRVRHTVSIVIPDSPPSQNTSSADLYGPVAGVSVRSTGLPDDYERVFLGRDSSGNLLEIVKGSFGAPDGYSVESIEVVDLTEEWFGEPPLDCGNPDAVPSPNPNPRPDPGLDPTEEPQPGPTGEPIFPMPDLPNPFGDPIPVPDFGLPFPFGGAPEGGGQPYAPPPPEPSPDGPIDGDNVDENGDNDFGDPPEGERWVGCAVDMIVEPVGVGSFPAAEPDRIYPSVAGNARLVFGNGERQLDTPIQIRSRRVFLWEGVEGCNPTGCRVNVAPGFSYEVTPFSVPIEPDKPPAIV